MPAVKSKDGTLISYDEIGKGGATLILVDGALCSRDAGPMPSFANELAKDFSVIRYDRRGRGRSTDTKPYCEDREIEDLRAIREKASGLVYAYGVSSGAVLCAKAAAAGVRFRKMVLFEPPLAVGEAPPRERDDDHERQVRALIESGDHARAVTYFLTKMVGLSSFAPWTMRLSSNWKTLKALAPTLLHDFEIARPGTFPASRAAKIQVPTLILRSKGSSETLRASSAKMADAIHGARLEDVEGGAHSVKSAVLIPRLKSFLTPESRSPHRPAEAASGRI